MLVIFGFTSVILSEVGAFARPLGIEFPCVYQFVIIWAAAYAVQVAELPEGAQAATLDIEKAYRTIPICPVLELATVLHTLTLNLTT
jgi:hypothetical protein